MLTELEEKQFKFLTETLLHYNSTNRGTHGNGCSYQAGCAIGRHCDTSVRIELDTMGGFSHGTHDNNERILNLLPPFMQELGIPFLRSIQAIHDSTNLWDKNGYAGFLRNLLVMSNSNDMTDAITNFYKTHYSDIHE